LTSSGNFDENLLKVLLKVQGFAESFAESFLLKVLMKVLLKVLLKILAFAESFAESYCASAAVTSCAAGSSSSLSRGETAPPAGCGHEKLYAERLVTLVVSHVACLARASSSILHQCPA